MSRDFCADGDGTRGRRHERRKGSASMSVLSEWALWYAELQSALTDALSGPVTDGLKQEIRKQAQKRVYEAYSSSGPRRGQIGARQNLEASVNGFDLEIHNVTVQQGSPSGKSETNFVESGDPAYRQPFARPFMDEALEEYAKNQGPMDLEAALRARGFTVE